MLSFDIGIHFHYSLLKDSHSLFNLCVGDVEGAQTAGYSPFTASPLQDKPVLEALSLNLNGDLAARRV